MCCPRSYLILPPTLYMACALPAENSMATLCTLSSSCHPSRVSSGVAAWHRGWSPLEHIRLSAPPWHLVVGVFVRLIAAESLNPS